jgi:hypothetical protein
MTKIYQKSGRTGYFANINGKRKRLGDTREAATISLAKLLEAPAAPAPAEETGVLTLGGLVVASQMRGCHSTPFTDV